MTADNFSALTPAESPLRKYAAALLPAGVILFGAVQTAIADGRVTNEEGGQLIALVAGLVVTYLVPLVGGRWAGLLKTGSAILAAVATLIIPLIAGFSWTSLLIVAIAVLNALATEIGVNVRKADLETVA